MAKSKERLQAAVLRKKGLSIRYISKRLSVSKSSASQWCRDVVLTQQQIKRLHDNQKTLSVKGRMIGAESNKKKRLEAIYNANDYGKKIIGKISNRELALICTALYWSEGSKDESTSTFMFVNSDPQMILTIKNFLIRVLGVEEDDILCRIQINQIHQKRIKTVLKFWENLLKLKKSQIKKPYFVKTKATKIYKNYDNYVGVCRIFVKNGKYTKYKILGMIKALKEEILPV